MELTLAHQTETQISVTCDKNMFSHTFDLQSLTPPKDLSEEFLVSYGQVLYNALFMSETPARRALDASPERILLVARDSDLDALPWEYLYGPDGFLILEHHFVRGLLPGQRIPPPKPGADLHIVAIPSNPLSDLVTPLNIEGEWIRLKDIITSFPRAITLERTYPPSIEQVRNAVAGQQHRVVHFMGHGGQFKHGAALCFEKDNGDLDVVEAKKFANRVHGSVFLVTLNACVSAAPGSTLFSNLAAALVHQHIPYALGMRLSIDDDDALLFSRTFYNDLARGTSVEEALYQARLTLASESKHPWVLGVPVLYTSLATPATGFMPKNGTPVILEHRPSIEVSTLPRAEGIFQGRSKDLKQIGTQLTGNKRPRILNIHGGGGQGKTALAREVVERFAYAWPDGVWGTSLEHLPDRTRFATALARFLGIDPQKISDPREVERRVLTSLASRHLLLVIDNAETLVHAIEADVPSAIQLAQFLQSLPGTSVSLLVTSRVPLGWVGETIYELSGLSPEEGADLFAQCVPQKAKEVKINRTIVKELSKKVEGHPLSLRLLGSAFNASALMIDTFIKEYEDQLVQAQHKYRDLDNRHRSLYACIDTSVRYLNSDLRHLLSGLSIFQAPFLSQMAVAIFASTTVGAENLSSPMHTNVHLHFQVPFLPQTAVAIFAPDTVDIENLSSSMYANLHLLRQRGLLTYKEIVTRDGTLHFYYLLPTTRPYVEQYMKSPLPRETLLARFGELYAQIAHMVFQGLDRSVAAVVIAQQTERDLERGTAYVTGIELSYYLARLAWIISRLGAPRRGLKLFERALEIAQGHEQHATALVLHTMAAVYQTMNEPQRALILYEQALFIIHEIALRDEEMSTLNNMAEIYQTLGQSQRALSLYEQALHLTREAGSRKVEATVLTNMAVVYKAIGERQRTLDLHEQALPIRREVGDRIGEAATLNNMAEVYQSMGQRQRALNLHEQALPIMQEMGNRAGEASVLTNMAQIYNDIGEPQRALSLCAQALSIQNEVSSPAGETTTLNTMAAAYKILGEPQQALSLHEQALPILREGGKRSEEATTLNNMAILYRMLGQPQRALNLCKQALPIMREIENHVGEADVLNTMATVYQTTGESQRALNLCKQVLSIRREVGDRAGEAATLNLMAVAYDTISQPQQALKLYEQALPIMREVGDRAGGATILNNMAEVYRTLGQLQRALSLYEQALPIMQEVGDRANEGLTLNNMALVYDATGQPKRALKLYEQALPIRREAGDRAGEAATLNNMAAVYQDIGEPQRALSLYEQALPIMREVEDRAGEAAIFHGLASLYKQMRNYAEAERAYLQSIQLVQQVGHLAAEAAGFFGLSLLLYQHLGRTSDAIQYMEQALDIVIRTDLPQDAAGNTPARMQRWLQVMYRGASSISDKRDVTDKAAETEEERLFTILINNTVVALSLKGEGQQKWRDTLVQMRNLFNENNLRELSALLDAVIGLLDAEGNPVGLGTNLTGIYSQKWQELVRKLSAK